MVSDGRSHVGASGLVRGEGYTVIDGETFSWRRGDVIAAPAWRPHHHRAQTDTVLFRVTDAPVMAALGLLRDE